MITRMGIFIGCGYGYETGIGVSTLLDTSNACRIKPKLMTYYRRANWSMKEFKVIRSTIRHRSCHSMVVPFKAVHILLFYKVVFMKP
jgi:hypothetical protein